MWVKFIETYDAGLGLFVGGTKYDLPPDVLNLISDDFYEETCAPWDEHKDEDAVRLAALQKQLTAAEQKAEQLRSKVVADRQKAEQLIAESAEAEAAADIIDEQVEQLTEQLADLKAAAAEKKAEVKAEAKAKAEAEAKAKAEAEAKEKADAEAKAKKTAAARANLDKKAKAGEKKAADELLGNIADVTDPQPKTTEPEKVEDDAGKEGKKKRRWPFTGKAAKDPEG